MQFLNLNNLPENLDILEQLAEQLPDIFFIFETATRKFNYLNPAFDELWGIKRQLALEDPLRLLQSVHPEDRAYVERNLQNLSWRTQQEAEFRIITPDGTEKWLSLQSFPLILNEGGQRVMGFVKDISIQKNNQFVLLKFSERKNAVLHSLSHDLAGPIHIINSLSDIITQENKAYQNERITDTIASVQHTCQNSISLIKELLNNEFLESANAALNRSRFDLVYKIQNVLTVYRQLNSNTPKNISFQPSHPNIFVVADESKIMQVFNNLISNANKFTPQGGNITLTLTDQGNTILMKLADTGIGIPEHLQPVLFDKFTKARRPGLLGEEPVGLGMSIIKNVVELHQGRIWFTSQENQGTTFYVEIPKE